MSRAKVNTIFTGLRKKQAGVGRVLWALAIMGVIMVSSTAGQAGTIVLKPSGEPRTLPEKILGIQGVTALYENLIDDPRKLGPVKSLAPALLRFPGGTVGNYYNWRSGQMEVPVFPNSGQYTKIMNQVSKGVRFMHPNGVSLDDFQEFCNKVGAETLLVPNLETSTLDEQVAWFRHMKSRGIVPRYIELGNEFWIAMVGDPNVMKKFPDAATAMKIMKEFVDAVKPYLPDGALIAAQGAGAEFGTTQEASRGNFLMKRMAEWDKGITNEPWFDAMTVHLYPEADLILGRGAAGNWPNNVQKLFPAMLARADEGTERVLNAVMKRFPGKDIWITEWNPNGVRFFFEKRDVGFSGMAIHTTARMLLAFLRCPAFTVSTYHMLSFRGGPYSVFAPDNASDFVPSGPAVALEWFNRAANNGAVYQRLEVEGAERIKGNGVIPDESYLDVEAALFTHGGQITALIQNAGSVDKECDLSNLVEGRVPTEIEAFSTPDPAQNYATDVPKIHIVKNEKKIILPAYSLTRVLWE